MTPLLVTPERRANWDRLVAEQHAYYKAVLAGAKQDNTTSPKYASGGRWSALAYQMDGDATHARRAYDHVKLSRVGDTFETAPELEGNDLREHGTDFTVTLTWIADQLTTGEVDAWRDWLYRSVERFLRGTIRYNDSDQVVGSYMCMAALDRAFGSTFLERPQAIEMREAIRKYCTVMAAGGQWPEGSEYSLGTMNLLFTGAEAYGLEHFPDVVAFRAQAIKWLVHHYVPGLKDGMEHGDEQGAHNVDLKALETLFAYFSQFSAEIRQFELDCRAVWNKPVAPLYPRYFFWADPNGPVAPWRQWAGTFAISPGVGQVISRQGWGDENPGDSATMMMFSPFSDGRLDHLYAIFGELRIWSFGRWTRDRPQAYSGAQLLGNHTIIAGTGSPMEVGVFHGGGRIEGKITWGAGSNAGVYCIVGRRNPPETLLCEKTVVFLWLESMSVWLKIERIHLAENQPGAPLARFAEAGAAREAIVKAPLIQSIWQSQTKVPAVINGAIFDDGYVRPLYPCTIDVVDVDVPKLNLGTIAEKERGYYCNVKPLNVDKFGIYCTVIDENDDLVEATIETHGDVQSIRVTKPGHRPAVIYYSAKQSPVIMTTEVGAQPGTSAYDRSKINGIRDALTVILDPTWAEADADVYVWQPSGLQQLAPPPTGPQLEEALREIARLRLIAGRARNILDEV